MITKRILKCKQPGCDSLFESYKSNHVFCSRKCYLKDRREKKAEKKYPVFICDKCGKSSKLNFDPTTIDGYFQFIKTKCPKCKSTPHGYKKSRIKIRQHD